MCIPGLQANTMSSMEAAHPKIETTGDTLRIEFPALNSRIRIFAFAVCILGVGLLMLNLFRDMRPADRVIMGIVMFGLCFQLVWDVARRHIILLSEKGLTIERRAFGIRRRKFYPLAEIRNLHLRYNPVVGKPPRQWELIFDRYGLAQSVPIAMTLPDGQNLKEAIYSRFPQLQP